MELFGNFSLVRVKGDWEGKHSLTKSAVFFTHLNGLWPPPPSFWRTVKKVRFALDLGHIYPLKTFLCQLYVVKRPNKLLNMGLTPHPVWTMLKKMHLWDAMSSLTGRSKMFPLFQVPPLDKQKIQIHMMSLRCEAISVGKTLNKG